LTGVFTRGKMCWSVLDGGGAIHNLHTRQFHRPSLCPPLAAGFRVDSLLKLSEIMSYRQRMAELSEMRELEAWYSQVNVDDVLLGLITDSTTRNTAKKAARKPQSHDKLQALSRLTKVVDGCGMIEDYPPLLVRVVEDLREQVHEILKSYRRTLQDDRCHLLDRYHFMEVATNGVGAGSVGTRCYVVLLEGRDQDDRCFSKSRRRRFWC
jgi:hypothetical protein